MKFSFKFSHRKYTFSGKKDDSQIDIRKQRKMNFFNRNKNKNTHTNKDPCMNLEKSAIDSAAKLFVVKTTSNGQQQQQNYPTNIPKSKSINSSIAESSNDNKNSNYLFLKSRIYLLSSLIGDRQPPQNTIKGLFGLILWVLNLCIHFTVDFYEAVTVFHASWASSIGVFFVMFIICTVFLIRHTVKWLVKILKKLSKDNIYDDTIKWLHLFFKYSPFLMATLSVLGAAGQYGCYAYDDALTLKFGSDQNGTTRNVVPFQVEVLVNIIRFTSLMHIYYMMFLLFLFAVVVFFTIVHSQRAFNKNMAIELKAHPPSMTFQEAVDKFAARTKLLRGASVNTTVIFSTILVATSLSFVVNAYNFLFIKRYAIYIWFAIAPLVWTVSILVGAALVTSSFQKLKLIVMQSWVEIPEKYDEIWSRAQQPVKSVKPVKSKGPDWRAGLENIRRRKAEQTEHSPSAENVKPESHVVTIMDDDKRTMSDTDAIPQARKERRKGFKQQQPICKSWSGTEIPTVVIHPATNTIFGNPKEIPNATSFVIKSCNDDGSTEINHTCIDKTNKRECDITQYISDESTKRKEGPLTQGSVNNGNAYCDHNGKPNVVKKCSLPIPGSDNYSSNPDVNEQLRLQDLESLKTKPASRAGRKSISKLLQKSLQKNRASRSKESSDKLQKSDSAKSEKTKSSLHDIVRVARTVNKFKNIPRRKFNYEKYIKFLELTLDTIGFSLGKMTITWDRVSFFIVLLLTLVGVFAQNAFLK